MHNRANDNLALELPRFGARPDRHGTERAHVELPAGRTVLEPPGRTWLLAGLAALASRYAGQTRFAILVVDAAGGTALVADLDGAPSASALAARLARAAPTAAGAAQLGLVLTDIVPGGLELALHLPGGDPSGAALLTPAGRLEPGMLERMARHLAVLLGAMAMQPDARLDHLPFMDEAERQELLVGRNRTAAEFARDLRIEVAFERRARQTPEATALIYGNEAITYTRLDAWAERLAGRLRAAGAAPGTAVGVYGDRSPGLIAGLLAAMKLGAPYVPLDPVNPQARTAALIEAAGCAHVLATPGYAGDLPPGPVGISTAEDGEEPAAPASLRGSAEDAAYIIFTSGSTGMPKGVEGSHRAALNRLEWMWRAYPFEAGEVCCQKTSLAFVDSIWEVFGPLLAGVPSAIVPAGDLLDAELFVDTLSRHRVSRIVLVPSFLRVLLDAVPDLGARLPALRLWSVSGEPLPADTVRRFAQAVPHARMLNIYGSSEVTADVTAQIVDGSVEGHTAPIGEPIANAQIYLLDRNRQPVPRGVPGEICVGGEPVATGYWRQPDLTAERFVPDPFGLDGSQRLFLTGDLGRIRADGALVHLGRMDNQVKIRGSRVEIGEIEAALARLPGVAEAVVGVRGEGDDKSLTGYVVSIEDPRDLRRLLGQALPNYMVPARIVTLPSIPRLPSGKPDRAALATQPAAEASAPPGQDMAGHVARLWADSLPAAVDDPVIGFFEAGGDSLGAMRLIGRIRAELGIRVPIRAFFARPTLAGLSALAGRAERDVVAPGAFRPRPRRPDIIAALDEIERITDAEVERRLGEAGFSR